MLVHKPPIVVRSVVAVRGCLACVHGRLLARSLFPQAGSSRKGRVLPHQTSDGVRVPMGCLERFLGDFQETAFQKFNCGFSFCYRDIPLVRCF